jgi:hypothetical protein
MFWSARAFEEVQAEESAELLQTLGEITKDGKQQGQQNDSRNETSEPHQRNDLPEDSRIAGQPSVVPSKTTRSQHSNRSPTAFHKRSAIDFLVRQSPP